MSVTEQKEDLAMLGWAITFFIIAIIAAVFGFGGIAGAATGIAQFLFFDRFTTHLDIFRYF